MNQVASPLENPNRSTGELHLAVSIHKELSHSEAKLRILKTCGFRFISLLGEQFCTNVKRCAFDSLHARLYFFRFARAPTLAVLLTSAL